MRKINFLLPISYIFNNQYDKAEMLIKEFKKNNQWSSIDKLHEL